MNPRTYISDDKRRTIKGRLAAGESQSSIARDLGVTQPSVSRVAAEMKRAKGLVALEVQLGDLVRLGRITEENKADIVQLARLGLALKDKTPRRS